MITSCYFTGSHLIAFIPLPLFGAGTVPHRFPVSENNEPDLSLEPGTVIKCTTIHREGRIYRPGA
jgi:hypothetical protein